MKTALTIAGSDCSGGAGIQADIKTMMANGIYAMSAITALTAQNTVGVTGIFETTPEFMKEQLDNIFSDIWPDAVKIGMVSNKEMILAIAEKLQEYGARNIVVDPVMVATSGAKLISEDAIETWKEQLFPLATVLTPNIPEAEEISGIRITNPDDLIEAGRIIHEKTGANVLVKGGHGASKADDVLIYNGMFLTIRGNIVDTENTHGTGCTLSSAIACNIALGYPLGICIRKAKVYLEKAMSTGLNLGKGNGPLNHCAGIFK